VKLVTGTTGAPVTGSNTPVLDACMWSLRYWLEGKFWYMPEVVVNTMVGPGRRWQLRLRPTGTGFIEVSLNKS
jgi:hypothetical protein